MKPNQQNLNIKTVKSEESMSKMQIQKKFSSNEISPTLLTPFSNKSNNKLNNLNTDGSIVEDFTFLKNELNTPLRKETNFSLNSNTNLSKIVNFNVSLGKIQDGMAVLLGDDMNLLELPLELLPKGSKKGNIFKINIERNLGEEETRKETIFGIQKEILENEKFFKVYD